MELAMTRKQAALLAALSTASLILALLLSRRIWFRLDITKNQAYTISPVSRNLYTEIPDQVRITYYVSDKLASIHPLPGEIEDLLREYAARSRGRIQLLVRDPAKAGMVQTVEQLGILPQQIQTVEQDEASIATVYTGIVIEYLDTLEVLPVVFGLETLEYDLSSRIRAMVRGTEREVGVIVGDTAKQWSTDYGYLNQAFIQAGFRVRLLNPGDEIGDALPVLFVLGGAEYMDEWALYRIDRYIQGGGKVFFALEGVEVNTQYGAEARVINDRGLLAMVSFYGATLGPALVLDPSALTISYQTQNASGGAQLRLARYPLWIAVLAENGNPGHPITSGFGGLDLFWASPIDLNPREGIAAEILFTSTPGAWLMTGDFVLNPELSYRFAAEQPDTEGVKILGAALSGKFPSWFAGTAKPVREGSGEELPDMPGETGESRIVVVGDTDIVSTYIEYTQGQQNLSFLIQAADWLGNDDDIIGIRNRQTQTGRLNRITDPRDRARTMAFARLLNVAVLPLAVVAAGFFIILRRKPGSRRPGEIAEKETSHGV
jgi:ABC-type uncharacterized transport system involved in gliding motility auxiliary subunit